jgi:hypothetical protein
MTVFIYKITDDMFTKGIPKIQYMMLKIQYSRHSLRLYDAFHRATAFLLRQTRFFHRVKRTKGGAH